MWSGLSSFQGRKRAKVLSQADKTEWSDKHTMRQDAAYTRQEPCFTAQI